MTLFEFDALVPVRTGRHADAATSLAWLLGLLAVGGGAIAGPIVDAVALSTSADSAVSLPLVGVVLGLTVAGVLLGLVASSVPRAVASGFAFGVTVVVAGGVATAVGSLTPAFVVDDRVVGVLASAAVAVVVPVVVGVTTRFVT